MEAKTKRKHKENVAHAGEKGRGLGIVLDGRNNTNQKNVPELMVIYAMFNSIHLRFKRREIKGTRC